MNGRRTASRAPGICGVFVFLMAASLIWGQEDQRSLPGPVDTRGGEERWGERVTLRGALEWLPSIEGDQPPTFDDLPDGHVLIEGDVVVPEGFRDDIDGLLSATAPNLWPGGVVPYEFDPGVSSSNQAAMRAAMSEWEAVANIDFRERTGEADYVYIKPASGNWSYVGHRGGVQEMGIFNWDFRFIMAHELAHALGVWHEHSRPDRDAYVEIAYANIEPGVENNFDIHNDASAVGPYDFDSVMHYGECAFSVCAECSESCRTIRAINTYANQQHRLGQRDHLSQGDIAGMQALYGPRGGSEGTANDHCDSASAVGEGRHGGSNLGAGTDWVAVCDGSSDVWFRYRPSGPGTATIDTNGSDFDTVLAVLDACNGVELTCDDDGGDNLASRVRLDVAAGGEYFIRVAGYGEQQGSFVLNITQGNAPPPPPPPPPPPDPPCFPSSGIPLFATFAGLGGFAAMRRRRF